MRKRPVVLTIAGSDSGGGAGLQADLKTFTALGVFGTVVVTGITAQNTTGVYAVHEVPIEIIEAQFDVIMNDLNPKFAKTGMLASNKIINLVKRKVEQYEIKLVLDPVMVAKTGSPLVTEDIVPSLIELARKSIIVTPNRFEAEKLLGEKIDDIKNAAKKLYEKLSTNVVVKGIRGIDYAIIDGELLELKMKEVETRNTHGSGDVFSASLTAYLALGYNVKDAVINAKKFVTFALENSLDLGKGIGPVDPFSPAESLIQKEIARETLEKFLYEFEKDPIYRDLIPHDEMANVGYLTDYNEVATLAGGIVRYIDWLKINGPIIFGINNLVTKVLLNTK
ncbi:MAG: bifunctional hydroxymethylpyrimidine kinase/phosphomethylpyrimidine kinase, partial [Metallosphaera sp.]